MTSKYKQALIASEAGYLSDEIEVTRDELKQRVREVLDGAVAKLNSEIDESLDALRSKVDRLGGSTSV